MKSLLSIAAITLLWALLYLTGLGRREIRGEEWRRTLPGRTMLNTGNWVVPYSGGEPFVRKPPLINWVSAASFKLTGVQNEWSARLPSVLTMLGASLLMYGFGRRAIGERAALLGVVCFLTSIGCIEKGRLAEIEVYYIAFTGAAFAAWLAGFLGKANRWLTWLVAGVLLGLALLAKGPAHFLFFYLLLAGVCWQTKRWRELFSLPHLLGILVCLGIALVWAIPFMQEYDKLLQVLHQRAVADAQLKGLPAPEIPRNAMDAWSHEVTSRVTGEEKSSVSDWIVRGPRALVMFLPWILFLPLAFRKRTVTGARETEDCTQVFRGILYGAMTGFAFMVLLPSSSPRYVAPLLGPVAMLLGWLLSAGFAEGQRRAFAIWKHVMLAVAVVSLLGLAGLVLFAKVDLSLPVGESVLWIVGFALSTIACVWLLRHRESLAEKFAVWSCIGLTAAIGFYGALTGVYVHTDHIIKPVADAINKAMEPKDGPLMLLHLAQIPYPFYLPEDTFEIYDINTIPDSGIKWMLTTPQIYKDWWLYFERRYGKGEIRGQFTGEWGEARSEKEFVLIRFSGK
ncbi:4-amino-4-deoxy-L-arabinose transferase-like glycosyltransferase [Roseimicrobium gellanilyticum]|uniref:4-amino-4-deoxy-L-arabinose transferase-like glycosyltransferase n=1 Tax=Roseimicrobium gellanilyticum TaxID=748857 RepID=A0A366HDM9_9BACT|nr:glycosyltransferase family 39 protein [Roseimicrobium gellanilyticum]RBP40551.1 4-amino-4-deoxy-L-arabinose transferase-like glycosyltransferase [Roseimicrobium gellanilyticum]